MKKRWLVYGILFWLLTSPAFSQYSISGYLDTPEKGKRVYLSLLRYDEQMAISKDQNLFSTLTDSTGYFSFTGKLLPKEHKLYRIHANLDESSQGFDIADVDELKNFHNFIFSNTDTIVFEPSKNLWFTRSTNTNVADREWRDYLAFKKQLRKEFAGIKNNEAKIQSLSQLLSELKTYLVEANTHPLVKLMSLYTIQEEVLKNDFEQDAAYYFDLQNALSAYYSNQSYALQFEELLSSLSIAGLQRKVGFYQKLVCSLAVLVLVLMIVIGLLVRKLRQTKKQPVEGPINLTKQEARIAKLILADKTNKEIASELFISLSTVKTHIRHLYAKYEVSNRQQLGEKMQNHPRD
ncbi:MAG: helix-turn-helix transcriptional regulator [Bacteroidota bacterium]